MGDAAHRRATYEDVLNAPPHLVAEVLSGELYLQPRPRFRHARAATRLGMVLRPFDGVEGPGGWIILAEPELHLGEDILVPDLAGWRRQTMPEMPDEPFTTVRPDWICEVLSPSTEHIDHADKVPIYCHAGVGHMWFVDPDVKALEVLRLDGSSDRLNTWRGEAICRAEPFEDVPLSLAALWSR